MMNAIETPRSATATILTYARGPLSARQVAYIASITWNEALTELTAAVDRREAVKIDGEKEDTYRKR